MEIVISKGASFAIANEIGDMLPDSKKAGLYWHDTRFLNEYQIFINGTKPDLLTGRQVDYFSAVHYLISEKMNDIPADSVAIARKRVIGDGLHEDFEIANHSLNHVQLEVSFQFNTDFADIAEVQAGRAPEKLVPDHSIDEEGRGIVFKYQREIFFRETKVVFSKTPELAERTATFKIGLEPGAEWTVCIDILTLAAPGLVKPKYKCEPMSMISARPAHEMDLIREAPKLSTNYDVMQRAYEQSLLDMVALRLEEPGLEENGIVPAAGIPWYNTLFGRDSIIAAYQLLPYLPSLAYGVIRSLAKLQGSKVNPSNEEEPGKILHEIRWARITSEGRVPHELYYGTVDATLLFIILISEVYKWTADKAFMEELKEPLLKALEWIDKYGDKDKDGYIEYEKMSEYGLRNQGWKDSWDSVSFADGKIAEPPIALCEVQGYAYKAKLSVAEILDVLGDNGRASLLRHEADRLKEMFNRDFWMKDRGYFAEALDKEKRKVDSITSNPGHLLWSGIVSEEKAGALIHRLLSPDMFSGWGIRTMSEQMSAYNPVSYHNGTIWPHDNSIIAKGIMENGFPVESLKIISAVLNAVQYFENHRLPELFCGFRLESSVVPVEYPASNNPQAWASGTPALMLSTILGMKARADRKSITLKPRFPTDVHRIRLIGLRIGDSHISFEVVKEEGGYRLDIIENPGSFRASLERWPDEYESGYRKTGTER